MIRNLLLSLTLCSIGTAFAGTVVEIKTSEGDITVELADEKAPITVKNFLEYVDAGHYDGVIFHRVIEDFMVQTGAFTVTDNGNIVQKETRDPIQNEAKNGLQNKRGTLAMARTSDPHSASAQFFINHKDNTNLDYPSFDGWGYAVFGEVTDGMDVVDKIASAETGVKTLYARTPGGQLVPNPSKDVPLENIVVESIKRKKD